MGLGFSGPPASNAAPSPIAGILGALSTGLQGFMQGRQFREEQADRQALRQERTDKDSFDTLQALHLIAQADPSVVHNPQFVQHVNSVGSHVGVNYGDQLPDTFSQVPFQDLMTKSPAIMEYLQGIPPEQRAGILKNYSGVPDSVKTAPAMITNPMAQAQFPKMVESQMAQITQAKGNPSDFIAWMKAFAPKYGYDPSDLLAQYKPQISQLTQAHIQELAAKTGLTQQQAQNYQRSIDAKIKLEAAQTGLATANTDKSHAEALAIPERVQAEITRAQAAAQSAANGAANVQMKLNAIQQLGGTDPRVMTIVNQSYADSVKRVNDLRQARDNLNNQWTKLAASQNANAPSVKQQIQALQQQASAMTQQLNNSSAALAQFEQGHQKMFQRALQASGAPVTWKAPKVITQGWGDHAGGKIVKMQSFDGGITFTDGHGEWFDANRNPINGPVSDPSQK